MQPMAATNTPHEFMHHLLMALCEWFLMFLMFMDAALGFILTKFAHHCELQSPCMFCLRLDHVFGEKPGFFLSLFCNKHRAEVSDLISCQLHHKLADIREMCDDCFTSIMKQNDNKKPFLNKSFVRVPSSNGTCSCCKIEWKPRPRSAVKLGVSKVMTKTTMPLFGGRGRGRFRRRNDFKRVRDRISGNSTPCHLENNIFMDVDVDMDTDTLSDSGCADLRLHSSSDSDDSFYEVDCGEDGCYNDNFRIINDKYILNQDQVRTEQSCSVSNSEPSLQNGHHKGIITGPKLLKSDGSIGVKENSPLEVSKETRAYNQDFHSFKDHKAVNVIENGPLEVSKETRDYNQDFHLFKDHKVIGVKENGPLEVSKKTRDYNQDFHTFKDHKASPSSDKHEGYESPGSSGMSEIEDESDLEKLKRQVEHYQERLRLLHKELEEERNAAAIAADEAMAMITRLQEEKAALHMEASQYLRMMDEQAEYDMEAVDKANDLVAEKDKEIQDLEAELEYFRNQYEDELFKGDAPYVEGNKFKENPVENGKTDVNSSFILRLEEEKKYILQSLSELQRKFDQFSNGNVAENGLSIHDEVDVDTLENDIIDLNERLETLEADRDFLEHACSALQSKGGLEFVQEIAHHLHDLRRVRFDRRCHVVT